VFDNPVWAVVELFGHNIVAGEVSEVSVAGTEMLRVDVPEVDGVPGFTKFYGGAAVYAITPVDEAGALHAVRHLHVRPISTYVIPARQLPPTIDEDDGAEVEPADDDGAYDYDSEEPPF
jgi:hypothetical protein